MKASIQMQVHTYDDGISSFVDVWITGFEDSDLHKSVSILKVLNTVEHPTEDMNLHLWAIRTMRAIVRQMEDDFVYTDHRPSALLMGDLRKD